MIVKELYSKRTVDKIDILYKDGFLFEVLESIDCQIIIGMVAAMSEEI